MNKFFLIIPFITLLACGSQEEKQTTQQRLSTPSYRGAMISPRPSAEAVRHAVSLGANILRYQMVIASNVADAGDCNVYRSEISSYLDYFETIDELAPHWILDLHTPLGGLANNRHRIFDRPDLQECTVQLWKDIATRMASNPHILAFELLNEPLGSPSEVNSLMRRMRTAVRSVTTSKPVIIATRHHSAEYFRYMPYYEDKFTWYAFHFYYPGKFTHHGIFTPSNRLARYGQDGKAKMLENLKQVLAWKKKYPRANIWVTEFGASVFTEENSRYRWFRDAISIWEANKINWTFHAIYECDCWSPFAHQSVISLLITRWRKNQ